VIEPIELEFKVACSPEHAFDVWATRTSLWWPRGHSVSGDAATVAFEPRAGGRIYERTSAGAEHEWGEVLAWEPPRLLRYLWHIYGDRSVASEVEITFTGTGGGTTVSIVHRGWDRLGAAGPELRQRNGKGWERVLPPYRQACLDLVRG
jgi:uncharacterized protein YndB with AHSA1/START domain